MEGGMATADLPPPEVYEPHAHAPHNEYEQQISPLDDYATGPFQENGDLHGVTDGNSRKRPLDQVSEVFDEGPPSKRPKIDVTIPGMEDVVPLPAEEPARSYEVTITLKNCEKLNKKLLPFGFAFVPVGVPFDSVPLPLVEIKKHINRPPVPKAPPFSIAPAKPVRPPVMDSRPKIPPSKKSKSSGVKGYQGLPSELKACGVIIEKLMTHPSAWPFVVPVDPVALNIPDYFRYVKQPMDFGTIKEKLQAGDYPDEFAFQDDVILVFSNCKTYNPKESDVCRMAADVEKFFNQLWGKKFGDEYEEPSPKAAPRKHRPSPPPMPVPQPRKQDPLRPRREAAVRALADIDALSASSRGGSPHPANANEANLIEKRLDAKIAQLNDVLSKVTDLVAKAQVAQVATDVGKKKKKSKSKHSRPDESGSDSSKEPAQPVSKRHVPMDYSEKKKLSVAINNLSPHKLQHVLEIVRASMPLNPGGQDPEEVEIDMDALDTPTLRALEEYVESLEREKASKLKRKAERRAARASEDTTAQHRPSLQQQPAASSAPRPAPQSQPARPHVATNGHPPARSTATAPNAAPRRPEDSSSSTVAPPRSAVPPQSMHGDEAANGHAEEAAMPEHGDMAEHDAGVPSDGYAAHVDADAAALVADAMMEADAPGLQSGDASAGAVDEQTDLTAGLAEPGAGGDERVADPEPADFLAPTGDV